MFNAAKHQGNNLVTISLSLAGINRKFLTSLFIFLSLEANKA